MHYKNGREAKNGDKVVMVSCNGEVTVGVLYEAMPGNDFCNGKLAPLGGTGSYCPNLKECLRMDDAADLLKASEAAQAASANATPTQ